METTNSDWLIAEIQNAVFDLCKRYKGFTGDFEVDGLICVNQCESKDFVLIKLHTTISNSQMPWMDNEEIIISTNEQDESSIEVSPVTLFSSRTKTLEWFVEDNSLVVESLNVKSASERDKECAFTEKLHSDIRKRKLDFDKNLTDVNVTNTNVSISNTGSDNFELTTSLNQNNRNSIDIWADGNNSEETLILDSICSYGSPNKKLCKIGQERTYNCFQCQKSVQSLKDMQCHIENEHIDVEHPNLPVCRFCGKSYPRKDILRTHLANHFKQNPIKCSICEKNFYDRASLSKHMKGIHKATKIAYCPKCLTGLKEGKDCVHTNSQCKLNQTPFVCPWCAQIETNAILMAKHVMFVHWKDIELPDGKNMDLSPLKSKK